MAKKSSEFVVGSSTINSPDGKPVLSFATPELFERWLSKHHAECGGLWIQFFKVASGHASITYAEALDISSCYGWIDCPVRKVNQRATTSILCTWCKWPN